MGSPQPAQNHVLFPEMSENPWMTGPLKSPGVASAQSLYPLSTLELCAGGGGQALGFEQAGIEHVGLVEMDRHACATLRLNRPGWNVMEEDLNRFDGTAFRGADIISGGLPCPPFSVPESNSAALTSATCFLR